MFGMRKGQLTIAAIMQLVMSLLVFSMMYPIMKSVIDNITQTPGCDPWTVMILPWAIPLTAFGIVYMIIVYSTPVRSG